MAGYLKSKAGVGRAERSRGRGMQGAEGCSGEEGWGSETDSTEGGEGRGGFQPLCRW